MSNIILIIPFVFSLLLLFFYRKKVVWWEYALIIIPCIILNVFVSMIMKNSNCKDEEYIGDYAVSVEYYEPWNEWIEQTCNRVVMVGKTASVQTYDCSYCKNHPPQYIMSTFEKYSLPITQIDYVKLVYLWSNEKNKKKYHDMNRKFYTQDGNMFQLKYDNVSGHIFPLTYKRKYKNKIIGSKSVFKTLDISKEESKSLGLYEYPILTYPKTSMPQSLEVYQNSVIGINFPKLNDSINYINAYYGGRNKIRIYMLFYEDKARDISFKQRDFWQGGNFNELIICIGYSGEKINWCETFSFEDAPIIQVKSKHIIEEIGNIDSLIKFPSIIKKDLENEKSWKCKSAKDYDYLKTELTLKQLIWSLVISILYCLGIGIYVVLNEFQYDSDGNMIEKY